ncbi:DUF4861 family protein [Gilvimarinus polysaccharolyticus]|uniref:DUF4861 family protein n=1 Tax=Gilvimarinus polysaccharolyticus TaxID=863921 RepID=UPI000673700E|nr:DUF4861 family protein [Gilvimarinus polysaccharolyticus]
MKRLLPTSIAVLAALIHSYSFASAITENASHYTVSNPLNQPLQQVLAIPLNSETQGKGDLLVTSNGAEVPSQTTATELLVALELAANSHRDITVHRLIEGAPKIIYPKQTYAELAVRIGGKSDEKGLYSGGKYYPVKAMQLPASHSIGNKLFKYEGFGWESEHIAYRFYFDQRGAVDIFGKIKNGLSLAATGLDGGDYHSLSDWGMDVLKVGPSLGLGAVAAWVDNQLVKPAPTQGMSASIKDGALQSSITVKHNGWPVGGDTLDLSTRYSIRANSPLTRVEVAANSLSQLATGIVKHDVQVLTYAPDHGKWGYLATYGNQSLNDDDLGMAIFFPLKAFDSFKTDSANELVVLNNQPQGTHYYFAAYWSAHPNGPKSAAEFKALLRSEIDQLNHPFTLTSHKL